MQLGKVLRAVIILLVCVASIACVLLVVKKVSQKDAALDPQDLLACFDQKKSPLLSDAQTGACLHAVISHMMKKNTPREILSLTAVNTDSKSYVLTQHCHQVAHVVGQETVKRTGNLEEALDECPSDCFNGCTHGAIGQAVLSELKQDYAEEDIAHTDISSLMQIGEKYCLQSNAICHGIGHIIYIELKDLPKSLDTCDAIAPHERGRVNCLSGAFMESFNSGLSLQFSSSILPLPAGDLAYPCSSIGASYERQCYIFLQGLLQNRFPDTDKAELNAINIKTCGLLTGDSRMYCFEGVGFFNYPPTFTDSDEMLTKNACVKIPAGSDRDSCIIGLSEKAFGRGQYSDARAFCNTVEDMSMRLQCLRYIR